MGSIDCDFVKEKKCRFRLFYCSGILSKRDETKTKWTWYIFLSRLVWFLWHVLGTGVCIWIRLNSSTEPKCQEAEGFANDTSVTPPDDNNQKDTYYLGMSLLNMYLYIACTLLLLLFLGPIQGNIIKRNCEKFPEILKNINKLDTIFANYKMSEDNQQQDNQQLLQNNDSDIEAGEVQINESNRGNCCYRCYSTNLLPKISVGIFVALILVAAGFAAFKAHDTDDLWDEYKLVAILFYLPLPALTTFFVVTLIKKITALYKVILDLKDEMFTVKENVKILSENIGLLQKTVELMLSKIVSFTIGINLVIFVTSSILCSYEIVQGIKETRMVDNRIQYSHHFAEVDYFVPLSICYGFLFWICRVSDQLMSNIHKKIQLRIRLLLQELDQKEPFKELEFVYKTLKEWPPQVYVYGGWKVNYQLLSAIALFIFTYSIKFYSFDKAPPHCRIV